MTKVMRNALLKCCSVFDNIISRVSLFSWFCIRLLTLLFCIVHIGLTLDIGALYIYCFALHSMNTL